MIWFSYNTHYMYNVVSNGLIPVSVKENLWTLNIPVLRWRTSWSEMLPPAWGITSMSLCAQSGFQERWEHWGTSPWQRGLPRRQRPRRCHRRRAWSWLRWWGPSGAWWWLLPLVSWPCRSPWLVEGSDSCWLEPGKHEEIRWKLDKVM